MNDVLFSNRFYSPKDGLICSS